jgi:hypothetical protein
MPPRVQAGPGRAYAADVSQLSASSLTTEETYYPATRELLGRLLQGRNLPFQVGIATSEHRPTGGGADRPDFALYDREDFVAVFGEVKLPDADLKDLVVSGEGNDQMGRYLGRTGVVIVTNIRSFGLVASNVSRLDNRAPQSCAQDPRSQRAGAESEIHRLGSRSHTNPRALWPPVPRLLPVE